ncbi:hypothetical protein A2X44_02170 [candidate division CPR3 bacterium GWF2_35_18]|uniref:Response regulatory domain-containing protein n=1 Tax=candidate division CPR3 bacterium GW2011_GWF2_35_18 TaxID=1618350 RepID=A0A0G0ERK0_UNCC3|nr:MAG: hypothetical protein UR67_C0002G0117 [candidate division CPR3 bacterium GW2011_GWF2_35_18]OGB62804.1 MAG: hypothetical protein A2X44_02170 [candidate division CPR3 bacterium GWF2_35_18]OGB65385.1 MAG: hypothetical protein A2250_00385 [candidate division CPR3 bacterium RIFOXYA2_FULL_35_13]OGB78651.1 MAG: hypothetical protein A2296_02505 [candidate division CPR3 bacterium RIFOXYB2_FULL_35_8]
MNYDLDLILIHEDHCDFCEELSSLLKSFGFHVTIMQFDNIAASLLVAYDVFMVVTPQNNNQRILTLLTTIRTIVRGMIRYIIAVVDVNDLQVIDYNLGRKAIAFGAHYFIGTYSGKELEQELQEAFETMDRLIAITRPTRNRLD